MKNRIKKILCSSFFLAPIFLQGHIDLLNVLVPIEITEQNSGLDTIDCIYMLNLKERSDRWEEMTSRVKKHSLYINRVEAINGWLLSQECRNQLPIDSRRSLRQGEIGCLLSHMSIWKDALDRGFDRIWILEDDILFNSPPIDLLAILQELDSLDPSWDILYTDTPSSFCVFPEHDHLVSDLKAMKKITNVSRNLIQIQGRWGTHSMIISRSGLEKLFQYFFENPIFGAVDYQMNFLMSLKKYACSRNIVSVQGQWGSNTTVPPRRL